MEKLAKNLAASKEEKAPTRKNHTWFVDVSVGRRLHDYCKKEGLKASLFVEQAIAAALDYMEKEDTTPVTKKSA